MQIRIMRSLGIACLGLWAVIGSLMAETNQSPSSFALKGAVHSPREWSTQNLLRDFSRDVKVIRYSLKGKNYYSRCIPLTSLIANARPKFPSGKKHPELRFLVKVQGRDGYSIWFSLSELYVDFGNRVVYLALDVNGKPFTEDEAPARLIVPNDKDHGRWIYGIKAITVVDGNKIK
jgi:hypothetical protein